MTTIRGQKDTRWHEMSKKKKKLVGIKISLNFRARSIFSSNLSQNCLDFF